MGLRDFIDEQLRKAPSERDDHEEVHHNAQRKTPAEDAPVAGEGPEQAEAGTSGDAAAGGARG
jgi:hypothetical protein